MHSQPGTPATTDDVRDAWATQAAPAELLDVPIPDGEHGEDRAYDDDEVVSLAFAGLISP